jgi:hypothetical protein
MHWLWHRAAGRPASWIVERSSGRIQWWRDEQLGAADQGPLSAARASREIDAGESEHELMNGALERFGQRRQKSQELTALREALFGVVG